MLDREKIVAVLKRRFPGSTPEQIATAANALVGLEDEWMEISLPFDSEFCRQGCYLEQALNGREVRVFSRDRRH
jgi:hypothetical protein